MVEELKPEVNLFFKNIFHFLLIKKNPLLMMILCDEPSERKPVFPSEENQFYITDMNRDV